MIRVNLNPKKKKAFAFAIGGVSVSALALVAVVSLASGWLGVEARNAIMGGDPKPQGYTPNKAETERYIKSLGKFASLRTGAPDLFTEALPKEVLLWKAREEANRRTFGKEFVIGRQAIGDCVSWGTAQAVETVFAVDFITGKRTKWLPVATEFIYSGRAVIGRGSMSDGWYGSASAKWIHGEQRGGVVFREKYTGPDGSVVDYTTYSGQRAKQYGYQGPPKWVIDIAAKHKVPEVSLITSTGEAKAALANGYAMFVCSGVGFEPTTRDKNGVVRAGGQWSHCMACLGYYTLENGEAVFVIFNSWGPNSTSGPAGPHGIPGGAFAIRERDFAQILSARDSFACSGPRGFERRDLDHETWAVISPRGKGNVSKESEFHFAVAP